MIYTTVFVLRPTGTQITNRQMFVAVSSLVEWLKCPQLLTIRYSLPVLVFSDQDRIAHFTIQRKALVLNANIESSCTLGTLRI